MERSDYLEIRLLRVGATPDYVGYPYLVDSILLVWERAEAGRNLAKLVYPVVAAKYGVNPASVERGIRTLIATLWQTGDRRSLVHLLGRDYDRPPGNSTFIGTIARRMSLNYKDADEPKT